MISLSPCPLPRSKSRLRVQIEWSGDGDCLVMGLRPMPRKGTEGDERSEGTEWLRMER